MCMRQLFGLRGALPFLQRTPCAHTHALCHVCALHLHTHARALHAVLLHAARILCAHGRASKGRLPRLLPSITYTNCEQSGMYNSAGAQPLCRWTSMKKAHERQTDRKANREQTKATATDMPHGRRLACVTWVRGWRSLHCMLCVYSLGVGITAILDACSCLSVSISVSVIIFAADILMCFMVTDTLLYISIDKQTNRATDILARQALPCKSLLPRSMFIRPLQHKSWSQIGVLFSSYGTTLIEWGSLPSLLPCHACTQVYIGAAAYAGEKFQVDFSYCRTR